MQRVLITGISGTGKSSVIDELRGRGYKAIDTDHGDWTYLADTPRSAPLTGTEGSKDLFWREDRIAELLSIEDADALFVAGAVPNQSKFYDRFDHIVLLSAPGVVIIERLTARTNNPYGKRPGELERVLEQKRSIEPLLRRAATAEVDTSVLLSDVVDDLVALCQLSRRVISAHGLGSQRPSSAADR